ncbi:putative maintenance of mitochondrial morphology protein 1 [Lyophyllum shimeji]|uniref:Maintenance of mitochondrial morphology protein 1 n=1 Tax=Lyophyllum shimeji TaxID=47721 RepID=A0A9P3PH46_LYOSH|nr:putative maintenance of mitochondrial morphology protein 1 [Lyophyllum shimeji]
MTLKALLYAYVLGGITFIPLVVAGLIFFTIYTSVPVGDANVTKHAKRTPEGENAKAGGTASDAEEAEVPAVETNDMPRTRKGWLTMRRTFEESSLDGGYVTMVRSFLDARSKDPKRSRPKDMWYVVLKGKVLYLYEDEEMTECGAVVELGSHEVVIYPEGLLDGELFTKRNAICLKPKKQNASKYMPSVTKEMQLSDERTDSKVQQKTTNTKQQEALLETEQSKEAAREEALDTSTAWFIFVRSCIEMEDWYFALIHASDHPAQTPLLAPLQPVFLPADMNYLVATLDEQPDVIPTRWLNALIGRIFFSYYRTHALEAYIIGRLMKKLSKVKRPAFLSDIVVTEVSVGNRAPTVSKPMLKELTKEGDAAMEVHFQYKGEFRITIEATATISLGAFRSYAVKLVLAAVLKELEGNLLIRVKRPPSNRIWYAFTQTPRMVLEVEPIVSDRQITWSMILSTIEARLKEIIQESVVMPNMDDIAFFDTAMHQHRGGIWYDASRHERQDIPVGQPPEVDGIQSAVRCLAPEEVPAPVVDEIPAASISDSVEEPTAPMPPVPSSSSTPPCETSPLEEELPEPSNVQTRRRSWFSSVRSEGSTPRRGAFLDHEDDSEGDVHRGRSTEPDKGAPRSRSTPQNAEVQGSRDRTPESDDSSLLNTHLQPPTARRSSSQHSKRDHTKSLSTDSSKSAPDTGTSTPKKSPGTSTPSSPNSFLSTLKSRAGDKEALSKTAKEAMRKWGMNWGIRKDSSGDDASDHGSIGSAIGARLRPDTNFNVASKARASYAEVRAAVAERRGKADRNLNATDEGEDLSRSASPGTLPVPVPEGSKGKARAASNPWSELTPPQDFSVDPTSYPESVALSTSAHSASSSSSNRLSVGESRSRKPSVSVSRSHTEGDAVMMSQPSKPIHVVQPTAKTMTIPGIHASHRGEIMSMGYNPPPQPPSTAPSEGKSSIYRLFKSPVSSGSGDQHPQQQSSSSSQQSTSRGSYQSTQESSELPRSERPRDGSTLAPSSLIPNVISNSGSTSSPQQPLSPRVPPPLPPRSTPASPAAVSRPPMEPHAIQSTPPSAEETLKSIATKDNSRRSSFENGDTGSPAAAGDAENGPTDSDPSWEAPALTMPSRPVPHSPNSAPPLPPRRVSVPHAEALA